MSGHEGKVAVVFGATGGLGQAIIHAMYSAKMTVIAVGRNESKLQSITINKQRIPYQIADLENTYSIQSAFEQIINQYGVIDIVVNAVGYDVRKSLLEHTESEIERSLSINLQGAINMTQSFIQTHNRDTPATIIHLGGFGDGRLAFPFYSVNVATRAGLRAFIESVNREMAILNRPIRAMYFGPAVADTEAERPFHPIWREMDIKIETPETIANHLMQAIEKNNLSYIMGMDTILINMINALSPRLADWITMRKFGHILANHLAT